MKAASSLNDRQRAYLQAIFDTDQAIEADMRAVPFSPFHDRPKAAEWRWLEYSEPVPEIAWPGSRLWEALKKSAPIDQGTGSTFRALADRGLVQIEERECNVHGQRKPYLRMTPAGRKLVRSWTGARAYKALPAGTLREWHWRALATAYAASDEGLEGEYGDYAHIGWSTWLRLRDYKWGTLVEERGGLGVYRLFITTAGRQLYETDWARYRELYPGVSVPEPTTGASPA
jgi:hypothetical protein